MNEIVDIKKARDILIKSELFSQAIKKVNDAIILAADRGAAEAELTFYGGELAIYEAAASLLESKGYDVEITREVGPKCSMLISWYFSKWDTER